jgi:predicted nucleic acid-binding protein
MPTMVDNRELKELIYLNYNCFQRGFDDHRQIKIQLEALACEEIFAKAERKEVSLIWSFMHEDENILCPFMERKVEVSRLSFLCEIRVESNTKIYHKAKDFQNKAKLSSKDAIHLACAHNIKSEFFLTCDEELIERAKRLNLNMKVMNPVEYIRKVEKQ